MSEQQQEATLGGARLALEQHLVQCLDGVFSRDDADVVVAGFMHGQVAFIVRNTGMAVVVVPEDTLPGDVPIGQYL
jgi:hypothetical protein